MNPFFLINNTSDWQDIWLASCWICLASVTLIQSCQAILTFLVNHGLLAARRRCCCGNQMVLRDDKSDDGYHWECPVNQCRKWRSSSAGSFCEDSKIPLSHWLYIIFLWSIDGSNKKSIGTDRIVTSYGHHGTSESPRHLLFKSFCLRDRGRLGNEGRPISLKIGTQIS